MNKIVGGLLDPDSFGSTGGGLLGTLGDLAGKLWAAPDTALGLEVGAGAYLAGKAMGTNPSIGIGNNAIQFIGSPIGPKDGGAITLGNVQIYSRGAYPANMEKPYADKRLRPVMGPHEEAHTYQAQTLGPWYLPAYMLAGGVSDSNPFENSADNYAVGKGGPFSAFGQGGKP